MPLIPVQRGLHMINYFPRVEMSYAHLTGGSFTLREPISVLNNPGSLNVQLSKMRPKGAPKDIDWGDGQTTSTLLILADHTYAVGQPYTITVRYAGSVVDTIEVDLTPPAP